MMQYQVIDFTDTQLAGSNNNSVRNHVALCFDYLSLNVLVDEFAALAANQCLV